MQVFATTHSSHFVSRSADDLPALCRLQKDGAVASAGQVSKDKLADLFLANQEINGLAAKRSALFFARRVLIVEGPTEVGAINFLLQSGHLNLPPDYFIIDAMGKFNVHRFMNLLGELKIHHLVLHDNDSTKTGEDAAFHQEVNELIQRSRNAYTRQVHAFDNDLEDFLHFRVKGRDHGKPTRMVLALQQGDVAQDVVTRFTEIARHLLTA